MNKLKEVISYILINYPHKDELSNARLTKMIYLSDWKQAIEHRRQITDINWYFDNYGPFVSDVQNAVLQHPELFDCKNTVNMFGGAKTLFSIKNEDCQPALSQDEISAIDHVINKTKALNWDDFINLVYSTHPISSSSRYSSLDLIAKAKEYKDG